MVSERIAGQFLPRYGYGISAPECAVVGPGGGARAESGLTPRKPSLRRDMPGAMALSIGVGWCLAALIAASVCRAASLRAGVAKMDITPPPGQLLYGYSERRTPAQGTLDPLYARVLVLEAGEKRLAWVDLDLGRPFGPESIREIREAARNSSRISCLLVEATHTHPGPVVMDAYRGARPAWETAAIGKIDRAISEAAGRLVEARIGTGYGEAIIGYNRRWVNLDGTVSMLWRNLTHIPTFPVDPTVGVLRIDTTDGKPMAILVNYACHPVVLGMNLQYSADFPGVMTRTVEEAFGGTPLCFFIQGAPGDINPLARSVADDGPEQLKIAGRGLGESTARIARSIHTEAEPNATLEVAEDEINFSLRWKPEKFRQGLLVEGGPDGSKHYSERIASAMQLPVVTVLIDRRIALMTMPGEPFVIFQMNWRDRCPVPDAFFLGYTNGYFGYFPTIAAAAQGGYGASNSNTWVEVGAGERMVDHAVTRIYEMLGRLTDAPAEPIDK